MTLCELTLNGKIYRGELLSENSNEITLKHIISDEISTYILPETYEITKQQILDVNEDVGSLPRIFSLIKKLEHNVLFTKEEIYEIIQEKDVVLKIQIQSVLKTLKIDKGNISIDIVKEALIQYAKEETLLNVGFIKNDSDLDENQCNILILNFNEILNNFVKSLKETNAITDIYLKIPDIFKAEDLRHFQSLQSIILST